MKKERTERNLLFPNMEFRNRIRTAAKERGFRSEQAFILAACENELERGDNAGAMDDLEARIVTTLPVVSHRLAQVWRKRISGLFDLAGSSFP